MGDKVELGGDYASVSADERHGLSALCSEYCWRIDNYAQSTIPQLFTDDGVWSAPGVELRGRAQLEAAWQAHVEGALGRTTRHQIGAMRFVRRPDGSLAGVAGFTVFSGPRDAPMPPTPVLVGEHRDLYTFQDGRWLFLARRVEPLFPSTWRPKGFPTTRKENDG